jgi:hypothetical protein
MTKEQQEALEAFLAVLDRASDDEREAVVVALRERLCMHCGRALRLWDPCHCTNDE